MNDLRERESAACEGSLARWTDHPKPVHEGGDGEGSNEDRDNGSDEDRLALGSKDAEEEVNEEFEEVGGAGVESDSPVTIKECVSTGEGEGGGGTNMIRT